MNDETQNDGLSRRDLLKSAAGVAAVGTLALPVPGRAQSTDRIVVNGLDASTADAGFIELLQEGGVHCVHKSTGALGTIADYYGLAQEHKEAIEIAKSVADIRQARDHGRIAFILGSQVATNHQEALFSDRFDVLGSFSAMASVTRNLKGLGVGIQGLCYNTTNVFGSGCLDHRAPLTRAGEKLVEQLHENRVVLDVGGHCGEQTSLDAIAASSGVPIVCTHTNFAALNPNMRAISDTMAEAIARTGGVIGITAVSAFHTHNADTQDREKDVQATLDQHLDQYDYAKSLVGAEHVGLGPDFIYGWGPTLPMDPEDSAAFPPWSMAPGLQSTVQGFEDTSKIPNLVEGLRGRGWTESELDLLLGANWLRVYEQVWGE